MTAATINLGSADLGDDEFVRAFESGAYPNQDFHHADHLRLAWIYVRRLGAERAEERIRGAILEFATRIGHQAKYHDTRTRAWLRLVDGGRRLTPSIAPFEEFIALHPWLLERKLLENFFSPAQLAGDAARSRWVEPDLAPLPFQLGQTKT